MLTYLILSLSRNCFNVLTGMACSWLMVLPSHLKPFRRRIKSRRRDFSRPAPVRPRPAPVTHRCPSRRRVPACVGPKQVAHRRVADPEADGADNFLGLDQSTYLAL